MTGPSQTPVRLSDFRGQTVVIAFFPKAGPVAERPKWRRTASVRHDLQERPGVKVLAISTDDVATLADWAAEKSFPVTFLSDKDAEVGRAYDVKAPAVNINRRVVFVVGPDGRVTHVMRPFRELGGRIHRTW